MSKITPILNFAKAISPKGNSQLGKCANYVENGVTSRVNTHFGATQNAVDEFVAKRGENANDMIMRVERLKKAERNGIEHAKIQKEYDNVDWLYQIRTPQHLQAHRDELLITSRFYDRPYALNSSYIEDIAILKHPFLKSVRTVCDKNYKKVHAFLDIKNNEFVDSYQFSNLITKDKGFIKVNFKDGSSKVIGKYDLPVKNQDDFFEKTIFPLMQKYTPELKSYSKEYITKILSDL